MKGPPSNYPKKFSLIFFLSMLFIASNTQAQERTGASEALSANTREFLSDPSRTGSLLGSIIAGAAITNPLAPIVGSVAGFMIGKSSVFSKDESVAAHRRAYMNRSLTAQKDAQVSDLTGLTGVMAQQPDSEPSILVGITSKVNSQLPLNHPSSFDRSAITGFPIQTDKGLDTASDEIVSVRFDAEIEALNDLQRQLSYSCGNSQLAETLSMSCYYYSR